jgi:disulfide bond formation protein DsbB
MRPSESPIPPRAFPWLIAGFAFSALAIAWLAEYGFGLRPCYLCYLQRDAYWATIVLALLSFPFAARARLGALLLFLAGLAAFAGAGVALYHVGIERAWWAGSEACIGADLTGMSAEDFAAAILDAPLTRCDEPAWSLFGISMAGYNVLYAVALAAFAAWGAWRILSTGRRQRAS